MSDSTLSAQMSQVIDALLSGANLTQAAARAGVHRNTIAYWRTNSLQFQQALAQAQADRDLLVRERAEDLLDLAFDSLRQILTDPKASPSVRLKAATLSSRPPWGTRSPKPKCLLFSMPRSNPTLPHSRRRKSNPRPRI